MNEDEPPHHLPLSVRLVDGHEVPDHIWEFAQDLKKHFGPFEFHISGVYLIWKLLPDRVIYLRFDTTESEQEEAGYISFDSARISNGGVYPHKVLWESLTLPTLEEALFQIELVRLMDAK